MKTELLAALQPVIDAVNALQDDPPTAPTGFAVVRTYVVGGPMAIELTWDDLPPGVVPELSLIGAPGNPAGPQDWQPVSINGARGSVDGETATYVLQNPAGQSIIFRLVARIGTSNASADIQLTVNADDYLQSSSSSSSSSSSTTL